KNKKAAYLERYGRPGSDGGWHFLTGEQAAIDEVTAAAGFTYRWDDASNQFAHASAIMIVTPDGKLSRYFYGIDYAPRDVKLSLVDSSENKVGSVTDQLLLYCYHYDPATGKYGLQILRVLRLAAIATLLGMGAMGIFFWRRSKAARETRPA
ncbi:MAG TPA: SCO family protein, partial [Blastocatellia bacterium]|nr:SCO family protein [Blastocatellia bacterium]